MYDCADQMNIKIEVIRRLGYPEALISHYLPGPAPSQDVVDVSALTTLMEWLDNWLACGTSNIEDIFTSSGTCPYCRANYYTTCSICAYGKVFGTCCNSQHYTELLELIADCTHSPDTDQIKDAIVYLDEAIGRLVCGQ